MKAHSDSLLIVMMFKSICLSWVGYLEHISPDKLYDYRENVGKGGCTAFSDILCGMGCRWNFQRTPWCVVFVFAMFWLAYGKTEAIQKLGYPTAGSIKLYRRMRRRGLLRGREYKPKCGDLVFYKVRHDKVVSHVGIVIEPTGDGFISVEGNTFDDSGVFTHEQGGAVAMRTIKSDYHKIVGYAAITNNEVTK